MSGNEQIVNAYFEPADNIPIELDQNKTQDKIKFGVEARICAVSVSHGNNDYVIVSLKKPEDTRPFWKAKFESGLNGQIFIQPIPKNGLTELEVSIEPKEGTQIADSVIVNISYI
ncbi:hypothetical protein E3E22_10605 [Thermococcus sp. MV5]|uniref:hypothetical protein n=1 Tax=Thermococcus sp. MV5 TaxID=1638272 RepID=UPI00143BC492|nr:hypothetical protein [Thermococcus sp. MV5]NJE27051.1 hypothetical protein [Thermococcus sp. MV5]